MSLIFDRFPTMQKARAFQQEVKKRFGLDGEVFSDGDKAHEADPFPWEQRPPIVHIKRVWVDKPRQIAAIKRRFKLTDKEVKAKDHACAEVMTGVAAEKRVTDLVEGFGGCWRGT